LHQIFYLFKKESFISFAEAPITPISGRASDRSIITDGYQAIYNLESHSIQLFNLQADPLAQNNIAKDHDNIIERLFSQFSEVYSVTPGYKASKITIDEETREQLKALGYIDVLERPSKCESDFDCDGDVDEIDAALFKADFARNQDKTPCTNDNPCNGDFDCDGDVDWTDAEKFKEDYGKRSSDNPCPACDEGSYCVY
jgi:hypothetical protein